MNELNDRKTSAYKRDNNLMLKKENQKNSLKIGIIVLPTKIV